MIGENGLLKQFTKAILERAMQVELGQHLGYAKHDPAGYHSGNARNGTTAKTVKGEFGEIVTGRSIRTFCASTTRGLRDLATRYWRHMHAG